MQEKCDFCKKVFKKFKQKRCSKKIIIDKKEIIVDVIAFMCPFCLAHCFEVLAD